MTGRQFVMERDTNKDRRCPNCRASEGDHHAWGCPFDPEPLRAISNQSSESAQREEHF